jgi:hypothetical protein
VWGIRDQLVEPSFSSLRERAQLAIGQAHPTTMK